MSLVNDMLNALEQRDGIGPGGTEGLVCVAATDQIEYSENEFLKGRSGFFWKLLASLLALAMISYGISQFFSDLEREKIIEERPLELAREVADDSRVLETTLNTAVSKPPGVDATPNGVTSNSNDKVFSLLPNNQLELQLPSIKQRIDELLRSAKLALLNDHLTDPMEDNAYSWFQAVLVLDPSQVNALQGIQSIVSRYVDFARDMNNRSELDKAKTYWAKAELIANQYPSVQYWLEEQYSTIQWVSADSKFQSETVAPSMSEAALEPQLETTRLVVEPSNKYRDQQIVDKATLLMAEQRWREAELLLSQAIAEHPDFQQSRESLFSIYLRQKNRTEAEKTVEEMVSLPANEKAVLRARLLVQFQEWEPALLLLEQKTNDINLEGRALLAAIYHQLGRYQDSIVQYQFLLKVDNRNAAYWLGLAVCFDALTDESGALRAFRFVRLHGGVGRETDTYVEQRIKSLTTLMPAAG